MKLHHIVAATDNDAIGKDGSQPFYYQRDLHRFESLTRGHLVIMGRRTFEDLPGVLLDRPTVILTNQEELTFDKKEIRGGVKRDEVTEGRIRPFGREYVLLIKQSIDGALQWADDEKFDDIYIAGGESIYEQTADMIHSVRMTRVEDTVEQPDTYYPVDVRGDDTWELNYEREFPEFVFRDYYCKERPHD